MNSPHVIHLVESANRHEWLEKLVESLEKKGVSQTLITLEPDGNMYDYLLQNYPSLKMIRSHKKRLNPVSGTIEVLRARRRDRTSLVFALGHPAALIAGIATFFPGVKLIFSHMQQPNYFRLMKPRWRGIIHDFIYNFYIGRASLIHSLSSEVTEFLTMKGVSPRKIFTVNIGVNFEGIREKLDAEDPGMSIPAGWPLILMVGRLAPEKNYVLAFETFATFLGNNPGALLLIAGVGPQEEDLKLLAKKLGIRENIFFLGYIQNVPRVMAEADLLLHLATTESYGQIYIEAILSQLPIVCSRTGVAIDLLKNKVSSISIVEGLSVESVIQSLDSCLRNRVVSPITNENPFIVFQEHDEKKVHERIASNFINFAVNDHDRR